MPHSPKRFREIYRLEDVPRALIDQLDLNRQIEAELARREERRRRKREAMRRKRARQNL